MERINIYDEHYIYENLSELFMASNFEVVFAMALRKNINVCWKI